MRSELVLFGNAKHHFSVAIKKLQSKCRLAKNIRTMPLCPGNTDHFKIIIIKKTKTKDLFVLLKSPHAVFKTAVGQ